MDLSVLVVSWNTRDLLERCLSSVHDRLAGIDSEIVVVDNASSDASADMVLTAFPDVRLVGNIENRGFARAVNQGIHASTGRYVMLVNSDATLVGDAARRMIDHLDRHPGVAAVGGKLLNPDGSFQGSYADFPSLSSEMLLATGLSRWVLPPGYPSRSDADSREQRTVDWVCGAFMMLRRAALDDIGLLDEDYFMYAEEVDWCFRARRRGWSVAYLPDAVAVHMVGGSYSRAPARRRSQVYRSKWLYLRKNVGPTHALTFRALVHAVSVAKLGAWALSGIGANRARQERARRNVASYRYLLHHF
ncbi:MAG: glycosyltransferase family 2 protein [Chloroflexi bacterium]|nr:glycosyltransferase family 2 protein [Chloroflexota bacterium]